MQLTDQYLMIVKYETWLKGIVTNFLFDKIKYSYKVVIMVMSHKQI